MEQFISFIFIVFVVGAVLALAWYLVKIAIVTWLNRQGREKIVDKIDKSLKPKPAPEPLSPAEASENSEETVDDAQDNTKAKPAEPKPIEYVRDLSHDYLKKREHVKNYPFCISPTEGKHYRFERNAAIHSYHGHVKGWAYLKDVFPNRKNTEYEKYFFIRIPRTEAEIAALVENLSKKEIPVILSEEDIQVLRDAKGVFDLTVNMNWFQAWCWREAHETYVYWRNPLEFFTMRPQFKDVHFSLPVQGDEGAPPVFENRREKSMNYLAKEMPHAKRIAKLKDSLGIEFTIEFILTGYCENPWYADHKFRDVFTQNDINIRGSALKIASGLTYLPQLKNIESIGKRYEGLLMKIQAGKPVDNSTLAVDTPAPDEKLEQYKSRIQQEFQKQLLAAANLPANYTGFVWTEVNIINVYPSGPDAETILELENDIAEAEYRAQSNYIELAVTTAKEFAKNAAEDDKERKRITREVLEIEQKGTAQEKALTSIAVGMEKMAEAIGKDNAFALTNNENFYAALKETGSNIFLDSNSGSSLGNLGKKFLTQETKKKEDSNET